MDGWMGGWMDGWMDGYQYIRCAQLISMADQPLNASPFGKLSLNICCPFQDETVCFAIILGVIRKTYLEISHA